MHTYRKSDESLWTVGYYYSGETWIPLKDFAREEDAADYVSYLNGGRRP